MMGKKFFLLVAVGLCAFGIVMEWEAAITFIVLCFGFLGEFAKTDFYKNNFNKTVYAVLFICASVVVSIVCGIIETRIVQAMILVASTCLYAGVVIGRKE